MPIVPHHQPTPVVQPAMSTLHLPATCADRVHLRRTAGTLASRPMTLRNRGTNPLSSQFPPELCAVVALVSSQRVRSLLGPASSTRPVSPSRKYPPCTSSTPSIVFLLTLWKAAGGPVFKRRYLNAHPRLAGTLSLRPLHLCLCSYSCFSLYMCRHTDSMPHPGG